MIFDLTPLLGQEIREKRTTALGKHDIDSKTFKVIGFAIAGSLPVAFAATTVFGQYGWGVMGIAVAGGYFLFLSKDKNARTDNFSVIKNAHQGKKMNRKFVMPTSVTPIEVDKRVFYELIFAGVLPKKDYESAMSLTPRGATR